MSNRNHRTKELVTSILMSYKRPFNIDQIARSILECKFVDRLIISNNNPRIDINEWINFRDRRAVVINQKEDKGCGFRWYLALDQGSNFFLAIDDDLFITSYQITKLFHHLTNKPDIPHGVFGSEYGSTDSLTQMRYHSTKNMQVDVIHQVYAVTKEHVRGYFILIGLVRKMSQEIADYAELLADDIVISHCGLGKPMIHNMGYVRECATATMRGCAVYKQHSFQEIRKEILRLVVSAREKIVQSSPDRPSL